MDHQAPAGSCCSNLAEKRRKAEPFIFFFGVLIVIAIGICLVTREAYTEAGPASAHAQH